MKMEKLIKRIMKKNKLNSKLNYVEIRALVLNFIKECKNNGIDFKSFDIESIIDLSLSYEENLNNLLSLVKKDNYIDKYEYYYEYV